MHVEDRKILLSWWTFTKVTTSNCNLLSFPNLYNFYFVLLKYKRYFDEYFCLYSERQHVLDPSELTR